MHYGFQVQVCNPASGHEKGSVENKVGYVRYNFFSETPRMKDFTSLNIELEKKMIEKRQEKHYEKMQIIESLWQEEKQVCLALPDEDYPVFKEIMVRANKLNEIKLDNTLIHIHNSWRHGNLYAYLTWDKYRIVTQDGEIIQEDYRSYLHRKRAIDWYTILKDWKQRLSKIPYSRYWKYLPGRIQAYLRIEDLRLLYQRIDRLLDLLVNHTMVEINERFYELVTEENGESISDWYETKSIIITSNLEFSSWNKVFIDPRLTSALVDRLIHHAHILTFTGESYRLKNALSKIE